MRIEPPPDPRAKLAMPVSALMASDAQPPAGLSPSGPQFRKNLWPLRNYRPELDFWRCQQSFRNWGQGDADCGQHNTPGVPRIHGELDKIISNINPSISSGALYYNRSGGAGVDIGNSFNIGTLGIDASKSSSVYGASNTVMPPSINQPVCLYLGRPAQV